MLLIAVIRNSPDTCDGYCFDSGFQSSDTGYPANTLPELFSPNSVVVEITDGSMDLLSDVVTSSPVSMVMLYAPWCIFSRRAASYFEQAAVSLRDEVKQTLFDDIFLIFVL